MKPPFQFQQFTVRDNRCAMKIGTDAVLLGAWSPIRNAKTILDVGTGCGIIALMLAQRTVDLASHISAIDVDAEASSQAAGNFAESPWPKRCPNQTSEVHFSLSEFAKYQQHKFDLIVSNPPFFESATPSPESARNIARHTANTDRSNLLHAMHGLLGANGRLCLVLPYAQANSTIVTIEQTSQLGMRLLSRTDVRPNPQSEFKRVLLEFGNADSYGALDTEHDELVVERSRHHYTEQYAALTRDFHLRYANPK